ncbi:MAG: transporter substrate-binding domain-containing protein [Variibacter sp.]
MIRLTTVAVAAFCSLLANAAFAQTRSPTVEAIEKRGALLCPSNNGPNLGFMEVGDNGTWKGFDIDMCRAIAVAILGSPDKTKFIPLSMAQRWPALNSGEVDIIIKTTDATMTRNTELGFQFSLPYIYGTFNVMAHAELKAKAVKDLAGGTICTSAGTNNARYMEEFAKSRNFQVKVLTFDKREEEIAGYASNRCDGYLQWGPTLAAARVSLKDPKAHVILPEVLAVGPQVMLMRRGDELFVNVVNWVLQILWTAEQMGITQANVDSFRANPTTPAMQRLLGVTPGLGKRLGLADDTWGYKVIKAMGNFGEIWDRNLGANSPYKLERGMNALWKNGGQFTPYIID